MKKTRILVVEDDCVIGEYIKETLEGFKYHVSGIALSGKDAIKKSQETYPDIILMDIKLGRGIDGIAAAEKIYENLYIPIIYLTSYTDKTTFERAKKTAPFGYIVKPFNERELYTTIEVVLHRFKLEKESKKELMTKLQEASQNFHNALEDVIQKPFLLNQDSLPNSAKEKSINDQQDASMVSNMKEAAKYLGISDRTVQRLIKQNIFPEPCITVNINKKHKQRCWKKEVLDTLKPKLRSKGRPPKKTKESQ